MTDVEQQRERCAALEARILELEGKLSASEAAASFLDSVLLAVPALIVNIDPELRIRYLNRYLPGFVSSEVRGRHVLEFLAPGSHDPMQRAIAAVRGTGMATVLLTDAPGANGAMTTYRTYIAPVREPDGSRGLCVAAFDVTEEKARERALLESEEKLRLTLEATGFGLWTWDFLTQQVFWDENMLKLHGGRLARDADDYFTMLHPEDRDRAFAEGRSVREHGVVTPHTYRVIWPDGTVRWVLSLGRIQHDAEGRRVGMTGGTIDVTRTRELEQQLRQSQKMEVVGNLTAGIAHNFNNLLAVILPTLEVATELVPAERADLLRQAAQAAVRAGELVRQLMTYAGQSRSGHQVACSVVTLVTEAAAICRRTFESHVCITLDVAQDAHDCFVEGNAAQLEQVFVNLLLNARDAILEAAVDRGLVSVSVRRALLTPPGEAEPGASPAVAIDVRDNGCGVPESAGSRLFEPFFTTKPAGRGTGLGLATSFGTVRDHGGTLSHNPVPSGGAEFIVLLPLAEQSELPSAEPISSALVEPAIFSSRAGGSASTCARVLVVDDDAALRNALQHVLDCAGVSVFQAASGDEALQVLHEQAPIDVVLLDRAMPGGSGEQFVPCMRKIAPEVGLIFLSGQAIEPGLARLVDVVLPKPISTPELLRTIRIVIERRAAAAGTALSLLVDEPDDQDVEPPHG